MAGTETYGGCCPKCLKGMEQKHESSWSGFMFDACPWCGFIYVDREEMNDENAKKAWEDILNHAGVNNREELIQKYSLKPYMNVLESEYYPSLFDYSDDEGTLDMFRLLWKRYGNNDPSVQINGQRVYWHENREQEGTLMEFKVGNVYILWDEHKGSKLPYFAYPATDVGTTVFFVNPVDAPPVVGEDDWTNEEVFAGLNYIQRKGRNVRELRETFMQRDLELFNATESREIERMEQAKEAIAEVVDEVRQLLVHA